MAHPCPSAGKAPLPGNASEQLHRSVGLKLAATLDDADLVSRVEALCVPWLLADAERLKLDRAKQLQLAPKAGRSIKRLAQSLQWMAVDSPCGQRAAEAAAKTLRALRMRRVDMDGLLRLEAGYRSLREDDLHRHGSPKVYAVEQTMVLDDGAMVATRVVSERLLSRLGRRTGNCLANPTQRKPYVAELKEGQTAFWRIDPAGQPESPVWVIAISLVSGSVREVKHVGSFTTMPRDRDALLEFLSAHARVGSI